MDTLLSPHMPVTEDHSAMNSPRRHDAGFFVPNSMSIRPHAGYRMYFDSELDTEDIPDLFPADDVASRFPSIQYAAGWAYADRAIGNEGFGLDERQSMIERAEMHWAESIRSIHSTYEMLPGRFLLWPCTKWRYQFAIDTVPTLQAIAKAKVEGADEYDTELLDQSIENVNETVNGLFKKYVWTRRGLPQGGDKLERSRAFGRIGAVMGVLIEGAALQAAQTAGGDQFAVIPPSLLNDNGAGIDLVAHGTHSHEFTGQIKKRVVSKDRKKYDGIALICATHHMKAPGHSVHEAIETVVQNEDQERIRAMGDVLLRVMQGSREYGCSPYNPRPQYADVAAA